MKSKLIALDIDGTILEMTEGISVPGRVKAAINEARTVGAKVCLCSSRPCFLMHDATKDLDKIDARIGSSGAVIQVTDESGKEGFRTIFNDSLPKRLISACIELARRYNIYLSFGGEDRILARRKGPVDPEYAKDPLFKFMDEPELVDLLGRTDVSGAFIFSEPHMTNDAILNEPALRNAIVHKSSENSYMVTSRGVDKGTGVLRLAKHYGIPRESILAIGNDENDIPMLRAAGIGVAVANASKKTLAAADWIAPDVRSGGAADAIRRFAL